MKKAEKGKAEVKNGPITITAKRLMLESETAIIVNTEAEKEIEGAGNVPVEKENTIAKLVVPSGIIGL